ncbi:MAG TPA: hypothetical protein VGX25_30410 [Actinophytocola sp.]|uniref:hypothetical protein n=1 Tax=Actinophytocola sp. TaxID=1872138 RepID=UPI002DDD5B46|nr:hypothetical protein [Actinophytocola sp.]HEV2783722.1 hypothetical protein [Actinophytocola sp.]
MRLVLALVAALTMTGLSTTPAPASPASHAQTCPLVLGYVCLARPIGPAELIPAGESRTYPDGLPVVGMTNGTTVEYCVVAAPISFGLPPWERSPFAVTVRSVAPSLGVCLL